MPIARVSVTVLMELAGVSKLCKPLSVTGTWQKDNRRKKLRERKSGNKSRETEESQKERQTDRMQLVGNKTIKRTK